MRDKYRLVKRTQLKRSDVDRIGSDAEITYDVEIFDDDDFYQQLLKDIIEKKTAQIDDPVYMSRRWLEIENLRQKRSKKKKVDTKASKGRRIRYLVIPQLVNYYPSMPESVSWSHEMRNQLMKSLFVSDSQIYLCIHEKLPVNVTVIVVYNFTREFFDIFSK
ncbi:unnamed protein product [Dracunculus medinensis]|uniref:TRAUB domain-containing protein n=1 Tax=Dracunculus medinensis TaxID=318479 RepID=A0A0N4ULY3_DRAME|nr:unnamed protein product [Dracunculus medinensis]